MKKIHALGYLIVLWTGCLSSSFAGGLADRIGGGNFEAGNLTAAEERLLILQTLGAGMCRIPISKNVYFNADEQKPLPEQCDRIIRLAHRYNITPMLLFEYYTRWHDELGGYEQWKQTGEAFARRFAPNSEWLTEQGITDWGVTFYSAINEPMWKSNNPTPIPIVEYKSALEGLADGVHAVDANLRVSPGGFQEIPLLRSNPYGPAIAPLYNNGKLFAMDIHRYFDIQYQPMYGTYKNSLQNQFDEVKKAWGITADIAFYTTEFNFKKREVDETEAAKGFLTAFWDALGVLGNQGQPVTQFVMPWNIFHRAEQDEYYGMSLQTKPWKPTLRGEVLQRVCTLIQDMDFVQCDPKESGTFHLSNGESHLWVWQNRKGWTNQPGHAFTLDSLPPKATTLEVYNWEGLKNTVNIQGKTSLTLTELPQEETLLFFVH
jgi:hypothetical protein